jgi:hypothetical protein
LGSGGLVSDVVDAVVLLVRLTVGVNHGGLVAFPGEAIFMQVSFLFAVPAFGVRIAELRGTIVVTLVVTVVIVVTIIVVSVVSPKANCSELSELIVRQIVPDDFFRSFFFHVALDGVDLVKPFMIILDCLKFASDLHTFSEGVLGSFQDLVADAVLEASQKELMLDKFEIPSALTSASVAPAAMVLRTAAMVAGFLSVRRL